MSVSVRTKIALVMAVLATVCTLPVHASPSEVDVTNLMLPSGVTLSESPSLSYDQEDDVTYACLRFDYQGAPTTLFFHDLKIDGAKNVQGWYISRQTTSLPNSDPQSTSPLCIPAAAGDVANTGTVLALTSSAEATAIADVSNLDFPDAFTTISDKFAALGFDATSGYMAWGEDSQGMLRYSMYLDISPTTDISGSPVTISIKNPALRVDKNTTVALASGDTVMTVSGDVEITIGTSTDDPAMGLGAPQLDADIAVVTASMFKVTSSLPAGLSITANPASWYFDQQGNTTNISWLTLRNSTSKPVSVIISAPKLYSGSGQNVTDLKPKGQTLYVTVPSKESVDILPFVDTLPGDLRYGAELSFTAKIVLATPSAWDLSGLKVSKGLSVKPTNFNMTMFNSRAKTTTLFLRVTQPASAADKVLVLAGSKVMGKVVPPLTAYGYLNDDPAIRTFDFELGSYKGDLRVGKSLKVTGTLSAKAKTKFTSTAVVPAKSGLATQWGGPQVWEYNSAKHTTTILQVIYNGNTKSVKVGVCALKLKIAGKEVGVVKTNTTIAPDGYSKVKIAIVPGDLRYGERVVALAGTFTSGGC